MKNFNELKSWQKGLIMGLGIDILRLVLYFLSGPIPLLFVFVVNPLRSMSLFGAFIFPFGGDRLAFTIYGIMIGAVVGFLRRNRSQEIAEQKSKYSKLNRYTLSYYLLYLLVSLGWGIYIYKTEPCGSTLFSGFCGPLLLILNRLLLVGAWMIPAGITLYLIGRYFISKKEENTESNLKI